MTERIDYLDIGFTVLHWPSSEAPDHVMSVEVLEIFQEFDGDGKPVDPPRWMDSDCQPTDSRANAATWMRGHVKWDGCSDWIWMPGDALMCDGQSVHFCGLDDIERMGELFRRIYQLAEEKIPAWH